MLANKMPELVLNWDDFYKQNSLINIPLIPCNKNINGINPFSDNLSFLQKDKYYYEFSYMIKSKYPEFKNEWLTLQKLINRENNTDIINKYETEWEKLNNHNIYGDLTLNLHLKAVDLLSESFSKIYKLIYDKPEHIIDITLNTHINDIFIYNKIKPLFQDKFFINKNYTSYLYNEETKLYNFNDRDKTIIILKKFLAQLREETENLYKYFKFPVNLKILDLIIFLTLSDNTVKSILNLLKDKHDFTFNNEVEFEIPYQDKIFNLKDRCIIERSHLNHYTSTINATYLVYYNHHPQYIKSIFGTNKEVLNEIQIALGSLITGHPIQKIFLFLGNGSNSKTTLLETLKYIYNDLFFMINYDALKVPHNFNDYRLVSIKGIDYESFLEDNNVFKQLLQNRKYSLIFINNNKILSKKININNQLTILKFPYKFVNNVMHINEKNIIYNLKTNTNYIFTWLIKGAMKYLERFGEVKLMSRLEIEAEKVCDNQYFNDFTSSEDDTEEEDSYIFETIFFIKNNTISSITGHIPTSKLYNLYHKSQDINNYINKELFTNILKTRLKFKQRIINAELSWIGVDLIENI